MNDKQSVERWLRARVKQESVYSLLRATGFFLVSVPVFLVNFAFLFVGVTYFYVLSRARLRLHTQDSFIDAIMARLREADAFGFGPDWWTLILLALAGVGYAIFFRRPRAPKLQALVPLEGLTPVLVVPSVLRGSEYTSLQRAKPTLSAYVFTILFALPMLLEAAVRELARVLRIWKVDTAACVPVLAYLAAQGDAVEVKTLAERFELEELQIALPQLWLFREVRFDGEDPQVVQLDDLTKDELLILSVA